MFRRRWFFPGGVAAILWWTAIILGVVEGLTEFLPVSSTGHLIVVGHYLEFQGPLAVSFEIVIQLGSILAVVFYFRHRLWALLKGALYGGTPRLFMLGLALAFVPAAVAGLLVHDLIEAQLFRPFTVALALIAGGAAILLIERFHPAFRITELHRVGLGPALGVGLAQVLALFPGVSRSGATIMGGLLMGMRRDVAAEFSFFLSIPTMLAATGYSYYHSRELFVAEDLLLLGLGLLTAFVTALVVVAAFLRFIKTHTFRFFGYYRIVFGLLLLALSG